MRIWRMLLAVVLVVAAGAGLLFNPAAAAPSRARTLIVAFHGNVNSIDPATACSTEDGKVTTQLHDRLVELGTRRLDTGNVVTVESQVLPRLAASWTLSPDRLTYTFRLKRGAKFPSGREVDAEAVAFSLNRSNTMAQCAKFVLTAGLLDNLEMIRALDRSTVEIKLKRPDYLFFQALSTFAGGIVDPEVVRANGGVTAGRPNL